MPDGWSADPAERPYRLEPGSHSTSQINILPATDGSPGRYFIAVQIDDELGQVHEDVSTVDYLTKDGGTHDRIATALSVDPVTGRAAMAPTERKVPTLGDELEVTLITKAIQLASGSQSRIDVQLANLVAGAVRGEAQVLSPYDTWPMISPWTQGFHVAGGETTDLAFQVDVPHTCRPGSYWVLIKVMYFGRLHYTEAIPFEILERPC